MDEIAAGMSAAPEPVLTSKLDPSASPTDLPTRVAQLEVELADAKDVIKRLAATIEGAAGDVGLADRLAAVSDWIMKTAGERL